MKSEELLEAMSGIQDEYLMESETSTRVIRTVSVRRIVVAVVAAVILVTTVAAAILEYVHLDRPETNAVEEMLVGYLVDKNGIVLVEDIEFGVAQKRKISVDIPLNSALPNYLEKTYMIQVPEDWTKCFGNYTQADVGEGEVHLRGFTVVWEPRADGDGSLQSVDHTVEDIVCFSQFTAIGYQKGHSGDKVVDVYYGIPERVAVEAEIVQIGGIEVLKVTVPPFALTYEESAEITVFQDFMKDGDVYLYWSDGNYIFSLRYPTWISDEEVGKILQTIYVEADIMKVLDGPDA